MGNTLYIHQSRYPFLFLSSVYCIVSLIFTNKAAAHDNVPGRTLEFIENQGQWEGNFLYKAETGRGDVYLREDGFTVVVGAYANIEKQHSFKHGGVEQIVLDYHAYNMTFIGARKPQVEGLKPQQTYYNYFLGKDASKWKTGIHPNLAVQYKQLYEGVDLRVASENSSLKYEFIVAARANPKLIQIQYEGQDKIAVSRKNLVIETSVGTIQELKPYAYQVIDGRQVEVACNYALNGNVLSYKFPDGYDENAELVIDPIVVFATFSGSTADNWGFTATYDNDGNFYLGGIVSGNGFPVSPGAFQATYGGGNSTTNTLFPCDIAIMKLSANGANRIFATYVGGSANEQPQSMVVDHSGNLIVASRTYSSNFPVTSGVFQPAYGGSGDIAIFKLNSSGTVMIASTFVGGSGSDGLNHDGNSSVYNDLKYNYGDDARSEVIVDNVGNIYVAASTHSVDFPVTPATAFQASLNGSQDAVVFKLNPSLTSLVWSTFLGGTNDDAAYVLALSNNNQKLFVAGGTKSSNFPTTGGTFWPAYQGGSVDGYIARFDNGGTYPLEKVTFIGTSNLDQVFGIQIDNQDNVYAMGISLGGAFPVFPATGIYSNANSTQFVIKLNRDLDTRIFSTVFGSRTPNVTNISPVAFLVDTCQNIYISGWGGVLNNNTPTVGTTNGLPVTPDAAQATTDGSDFYFIVLSPNAGTLLYATYMGRNGGTGEHVDGGTSRFDRNGVVYQAICGGCGGGTFPTTAGSWSPQNQSSNCNMVGLKIAFQVGPIFAEANATPNTKGCAPLTVQFNNTSSNAMSYEWHFGDGSPVSNVASPSHTFTNAGVYDVLLIAFNDNACNAAKDSTYLRIIVDTATIDPNFTYVLLDSCGPYQVEVTNASRFSSNQGSANYTTFEWDFGDGTTYVGMNPPVHNYSAPNSFTIRLTMTDTSACNSPKTVEKTVNFQNNYVIAGADLPEKLCIGSNVNFINSSNNATGYWWSFGDGKTSTQENPTHAYDTAGTYEVMLVANNPNTCNLSDTVRKSITFYSRPKAFFVHTPVIPVTNSPVTFNNQSINATSYTWDFGDNTRSNEINPVHMYRQTGQYRTCLVAKNYMCEDTFCRRVDADVKGVIDVPTAFSPNGDGSNDILYVRGGAVETMNFKLFNRFGELVFETNSLSIGWDGRYNGKEQRMDTYAYILQATFIDGKSMKKTGNITLLR